MLEPKMPMHSTGGEMETKAKPANLKPVIFQNPRSKFLLWQIEWADRWLATPVDQLPGELTHEKCHTVKEDAQDELIEYYGLQVIA